MIQPGTVIAGYRIRRMLGAGGMGTVYAVDDPQLPRLDALKVLPAQLSSDPNFRARFIREADVAAGLDHPNIVSIYDRGETNQGQLWISMQLVDGTDADAAIRNGTMTPQRAVHIVSAVADALDYAHGRRVLHRDVKPANFLLAGPAGPSERVLLGDFGIARAVDDAGITGTNQVMATMAYVAPEVLEGHSGDYRSDLYSLGCTLFQLLTGQVPYADTAGTPAQALAHLQYPPPRVSATAPALGAAFDTVIATAMAKNPDQRYQSGRQLADAARQALHVYDPTTRPITVGSGGPATVPARSKRKKLIGIGVAVAVLIAGAAGAVLVTRTQDRGSAMSPTVAGGQEPAAAAPIVPTDQLPSLMLPADRIKEAVGKAVQAAPDPMTGFSFEGSDSCIAAAFPFQDSSYANSGVRGAYGLRMLPVDEDKFLVAFQSVVAFPTAELANQFIARQRTLWQPCAFKQTRESTNNLRPGESGDWRLGQVNFADGMLTTTATIDPAKHNRQHALMAVNNIVIDVIAVTSTNANSAATIAREIADKIPH